MHSLPAASSSPKSSRFDTQRLLQKASPASFHPHLASALWTGLLLVVIVGELLPGKSRPIQLLAETYISDKILHFTAYAVLSLVPGYLFGLPAAWKYLLTTELIGCALELLQLFVDDRSCDIYDLLANTIGVLLGAAFGIIIRSRVLRVSGQHAIESAIEKSSIITP